MKSCTFAQQTERDLFKQFGIFSKEVGMEFRSKILARGDSEDPADLYRGFMGRDPDVNALLSRNGLID